MTGQRVSFLERMYQVANTELNLALNRQRELLPQMSNITVQISKECMRLVRSLSQPNNFIIHIGVFRAGN